MAEKPVMHGWDHRPGGYDPIPGLGGGSGLPWALMACGEGFTVDHSGALNAFNMVAGDLYTNDTSIFAAANHNFGSGSVGTLEVLTEGFYRFVLNGQWTTLQSTAVGEVNCQIFGGGGGINPGWLFGRQAVNGNDTFAGIPGTGSAGIQTFSNFILNLNSGDVPAYIGTWGLQYNATTNGTVDYVQIYIEQVNPAPFTSSFFPIFAPYS